MRVLIYAVVAIVLICVVVPLVQAVNEGDVKASCDEKIMAIEDAESRFLADYGVHSSEYRNLAYMNNSSDLVILNYIDKEYLVCEETNHLFKWTKSGDDVIVVCTPQ